MIFVRLLTQVEVQMASDLADRIYPKELCEPSGTFESVYHVYPRGAVGLFLDEQLIGYAFFFPWVMGEVFPIGGKLDPNKRCDPRVVYLHDIAVAPEHRRRGHGTFLVDAVLSTLRKDFVYAHGVSVLDSFNFWSRFDFKAKGNLNYNGVPGIWVFKDLTMQKDFCPGYHMAPIPRGTYGHFSKIEEEFHELKDALGQGNKVMALIEMSDLLGAIEGYLETEYGNKMTLDDLRKMAHTTHRAFESGARK